MYILLVLFKQATSSLDTETERSIQDSLQLLGQNRTLIVIAHRLSTVQDADCIYVLEQGVVVEKGRHEELLARPSGRYAELVLKMTQNGDTQSHHAGAHPTSDEKSNNGAASLEIKK